MRYTWLSVMRMMKCNTLFLFSNQFFPKSSSLYDYHPCYTHRYINKYLAYIAEDWINSYSYHKEVQWKQQQKQRCNIRSQENQQMKSRKKRKVVVIWTAQKILFCYFSKPISVLFCFRSFPFLHVCLSMLSLLGHKSGFPNHT